MEKITVDISPTGLVKLDLEGFQGTSCKQLTEQLEITLGGQKGNKKTDYKPEFSAPVGAQNNLKDVW